MSASLPTKSKNSLFPPDGNSLSHTENLPLTSTELVFLGLYSVCFLMYLKCRLEGSASESSCVKKQQKLSVWPRFTDADISLEKWVKQRVYCYLAIDSECFLLLEDAVGKARDKGKGAV